MNLMAVFLTFLVSVLYLISSEASGGDAGLTSKTERPCPGDDLVFTCNVSGVDLFWQVFNSDNILVALFSIDVNSMVNNPGPQDTMAGFTATLQSRTGTSPDDITIATLTTTASAQIDGYTIDCSSNMGLVGQMTIQLADPPLSPAIDGFTSQDLEHFADSVSVAISWTPPDNNGGADVDNYTVNISPSTQLSATVVTSTTVTVTADYGVDYTLSVVATNCAGNSDSALYNFSVSGCPSLTAPSNGVLNPVANEAFVPGATVTLSCNQGFMPTGPTTVMCMVNLMWFPDPNTFVCVTVPTIAPPVTCGPPQPPSNGSVNFVNQSPTYVERTTLTYQCDDGLFPNNTKTTTCRDMSGMGEWDPDPADLVCRINPAICGIPNEPLNGTILDYDNISTIEGSVITFQCNPGLSPEGVMTATCTNDGVWSPDPAGMECFHTNVCTMPCVPVSNSLDVGGAVGISVVLSSVVSVIVGLVVGMMSMYCVMHRNKEPTRSPQQQQTPPPAGPVYEEVSQREKEIELKTNQAYGPVGQSIV